MGTKPASASTFHGSPRPPRAPEEPILARTNRGEPDLSGLAIAAATTLAFVLASGLYAGGMAAQETVTVSCLTLAFTQL